MVKSGLGCRDLSVATQEYVQHHKNMEAMCRALQLLVFLKGRFLSHENKLEGKHVNGLLFLCTRPELMTASDAHKSHTVIYLERYAAVQKAAKGFIFANLVLPCVMTLVELVMKHLHRKAVHVKHCLCMQTHEVHRGVTHVIPCPFPSNV